MVFLKLLLNTCLTFITAKAFFTDVQIELYKKYLNDIHSIIPQHYNVQLVPDMELNIFYGECNVSIKILTPTQYLTLYSKIECINNIIVTDNPPKFHDKEMTVYPVKYSCNKTNENIEIFFMNLMSPGHYILNMKYYNIISDDTELTTFYEQKDEGWLIPTHFDILGTRQVFPRLSEFFLVSFNFSIKHHRNYTALSNMPIQKVEINDEDMLTYFQTTPVVPTYFIAGIVTNFYHNSSKNMITNMWYRNCSAISMVFAQGVIENITFYLENEWKYLRVISKVNHVAIPNFQDKSMMNLGLVVYREEDIIYDERLDSAARKVDVARLVGFKVTMEWFYNVHGFLILTWTSIWFNDCLIRFFGTYAVDKVLPESRLMDLFVVQFHHESLDFDTTYNSFNSFNNSFEFSRCIKVSIMLRMLQTILSEKIFWSAIRIYMNYNIQKHYLDYINLIKSLDESMNDAHFNEIKNMSTVIRIMDPWTKQKHYPTISVKRHYDHPYGKMEVLIKNYNASHHYCIPLTYTAQTNINFGNFLWPFLQNKNSFLLSPYLQNETEPLFFYLPFKEDGWVIFNLQQIGYYRVNYDIENWKRIASYLASENYIKIHVINRAQIIDDAFHFMITKQLNSSIFWKITEYLIQETDYVAWYPMFKAMEYMSGVFPLPEKKVDVIKTRVRDILRTLLGKIQYDMFVDTNQLRIYLREEAAKWACVLNDSSCKEKANYMLEQHLAKPKEHKILPWWKAWTYCRGLITAKSDSWKTLYRMGMEKSDTKFLEYLACFQNTYIIINYLDLRYEENITKPEYQEHVNSYLFIIAKHANNNDILEAIFLNFNKILPTQVSIAAAMTIMINNIYNKDNFKQITKFMIDEYRRAKIEASVDRKEFYNVEKIIQTLRNMEQLTKKIENKIKIRCDQIDKQTEYFQNFLITE